MVKGAECINDGEINYDNSSSRIESKRSHQWLMDGEAELFPNKKQAIGVPTNNLFTGMLSTNATPWGNASSFQSVSGHFTERFLDSETNRAVDFDDRSIASVSSGKINSIGRKLDGHLFGNDSPFGLSMPHMMEDPRSGLNYGGIRKVKVSQVKESENVMPASLEHAFSKLTSSYELLMAQPSFRRSEVRNDNELVKSNVDTHVSALHVATSGTDNVSKKKDDIKTAKKLPSNNFPSNVRSLLSTGMLDGVPVKYTAWSQEKELHGVIKGSGYLCGCQTCNFSKNSSGDCSGSNF
ncbi:hypothetical protein D5086_012491 [Populus alba]|uniref:Uncharacterized protein n=1 Tax=Populus alba TaxID=43335 RepID=A0ACC4C2A1_POPAL